MTTTMAREPHAAEAAHTHVTSTADKMLATKYRYATVNGRRVFYREAGDPSLPTILLLHGLPTSSQMFRDLIPLLSDAFHLVAPDYIGFGRSDAPSNKDFEYTFDNLTPFVTGLIDQLGLKSYIIYMQDYGGPIGTRIFTSRPGDVAGFIVQNANAYTDGIGEAFKAQIGPLWEKRDAMTEKPAREFIEADGTRMQWLVGAQSEENVNPDNWTIDQSQLDRPGTQDYQVDLLADYPSNVALYESLQAAFREHQPKTLIVWGKNDPIFVPAGAEAFKRDIPDAKIVFFEGGHFILDEHARQIAREIRSFF